MNYTIYSVTESIVKGKVKSRRKKELTTDDLEEVEKTVKKLRDKKFKAIIVLNNEQKTSKTYNLVRNNYILKTPKVQTP